MEYRFTNKTGAAVEAVFSWSARNFMAMRGNPEAVRATPGGFVLWGGPAQKACAKLPRDGHLFIETPHPSPLSVHRGFYGSRPFSKVNAWLASQGQKPVDWAA